MSTPADVISLASPAPRFAFIRGLRLGDLPLIPVLTLAGINLVIMVSVSVVVETVFAWPGVGRLLYEGITFRDFPVVQGVVLMLGCMTVVANLVVDILYAVIDPRIRLEK